MIEDFQFEIVIGSKLLYWKKNLIYYLKVDVTSAMSYAMGPKDEQEMNMVKRACKVSCDLYNKYLKDQIMDTITSEDVTILQYII